MATLQQAIDAIQADLGALDGIRGAPDEAPESINVFPFVVCYPSSGEWRSDIPGAKIGLHTITVELHVARKDLPRDIQKAMAYSESIPNALLKAVATTAGDRFAGTIATFDRITYTFGPLGWGGMETFGFRFQISGVKMQSDIS
jgi:hypothetical protein